MSIEEAIRILDHETSADAITEIKYYVGFNEEKAIKKVEDACIFACDIMRKHLEDTEIMFSDNDCYDDLKQFSQQRLISLFLKMKKLFNKACERCNNLEKENIELTDLDKLIDGIPSKRKIQYYDNGKQYHTYFVKGERNSCGCGSNCYHYEYDGKKIYGVCNACNTVIYELKDEYVEDRLKEGIWK